MLEGFKDALQYVVELGIEKDKPKVLEICGKTYSNRNLVRYGEADRASAINASSLSSLVDYITDCYKEFPRNRDMIIHVESPKRVRLISQLDEDRKRECLFVAEAETSEFNFGKFYDQERFMIELQSNFQSSDDLDLIMQVAGNVEKKNDQTYSDDGRSQVVTMNVGVASKASALVPNPVRLIPFRTFQEVQQPESKFVFRIGNGEVPTFSLIEAENGIWKNEAVANIKAYFSDNLSCIPEELRKRILIIG